MPEIIPLPADYASWLAELKSRIHVAQQRATLAVNRELVRLYWQIGRDILDRQGREGWGAKVIERLAQDLRNAFPDMKGFSPRNLKYMRAFAEAWPDGEFVQEVLAQLPWYHQLALLDKLPGPETRRWYAAKAIEHNWSRNILVMQIETRLLERSGQAVTNFPATLPQPQSDLARESLKDPYRFDFLGLTEEAEEREIEKALVKHVRCPAGRIANPPAQHRGDRASADSRRKRRMNPRIEVVAAVIERADGAFLMASRPEGKAYAGWWEFPGGKVEAGESLAAALARELHEELGITVQTAYPWITREFDYAHARVRLNFFRVTAWSGEPHPHEGQGGLAWTQADAPTVAPILPANGPILRGLQLPLEYAISEAEKYGTEEFLRRLEMRLQGGLRLVQLREKAFAPAEYAALAAAVAERCRAYGAKLLINAHLELAAGVGAGVHLNSQQLQQLGARPDLPWVAASCHNAAELARAVEVGCDFVVLSPVLPTASHPGEPTLGWPAFTDLVRGYPLPVFALGGQSHKTLDTARRHGAHGIAVKGSAWKS